MTPERRCPPRLETSPHPCSCSYLHNTSQNHNSVSTCFAHGPKDATTSMLSWPTGKEGAHYDHPRTPRGLPRFCGRGDKYHVHTLLAVYWVSGHLKASVKKAIAKLGHLSSTLSAKPCCSNPVTPSIWPLEQRFGGPFLYGLSALRPTQNVTSAVNDSVLVVFVPSRLSTPHNRS